MAKKVYYIPEGLENLKPLFPGLDMNSVNKWTVLIKTSDDTVIAESRINEVGCCCNEREKVRIYFVNAIGEIDSINFTNPDIADNIKSENWQKSLRYPLDRTKGGTYRTNVASVDVYEAKTQCYYEKDQRWILELMQTTNAWIEMKVDDSDNEYSNKEKIPIIITDVGFPIKKSNRRNDFIVTIKFKLSNDNNTRR